MSTFTRRSLFVTACVVFVVLMSFLFGSIFLNRAEARAPLTPSPQITDAKSTRYFNDYIHTYTINGTRCITVAKDSGDGGIAISCDWRPQ